MKKILMFLSVVLLFVFAVGSSAHAGSIYTTQSSFDAAVAGYSQVWGEDFEGFATGSVSNPFAIASGNAELLAFGAGNGLIHNNNDAHAWMSGYTSSGNDTWVRGIGGAALGVSAMSFDYAFSGSGGSGAWDFFSTLGHDIGPSNLNSNANLKHFIGWVGSGTETLTNAHVYRGGTDILDNVKGFEAEPVPEPSTMILLGIGIAGFFGFRKKFNIQ